MHFQYVLYDRMPLFVGFLLIILFFAAKQVRSVAASPICYEVFCEFLFHPLKTVQDHTVLWIIIFFPHTHLMSCSKLF